MFQNQMMKARLVSMQQKCGEKTNQNLNAEQSVLFATP